MVKKACLLTRNDVLLLQCRGHGVQQENNDDSLARNVQMTLVVASRQNPNLL